jgi:hypothetical protein
VPGGETLMARTKLMKLALLLPLVCLSFSATVEAQNQKPNENDQPVKALLEEVRLLRQTLQRLNLGAYRSQILVERIRAQNDRVARLSRSLEDTRGELAEEQVSINQFSERAKTTDNQLQQETDDKRKGQIEVELRELKYMIDFHKQKEQRLREREIRSSEQLKIEQAKLDEFDNRLDLLEREISSEIEKQELENKGPEQRKRP